MPTHVTIPTYEECESGPRVPGVECPCVHKHGAVPPTAWERSNVAEQGSLTIYKYWLQPHRYEARELPHSMQEQSILGSHTMFYVFPLIFIDLSVSIHPNT